VNSRDYDYIETRLLAPDVPASEAAARLRAVGEEDLANDLLRARTRFYDECRDIRRRLAERQNARITARWQP
jgi:hypothetical protein